jgi:hypothetical protein
MNSIASRIREFSSGSSRSSTGWLVVGAGYGLVGASFQVVLTRVISYVSPYHLLSWISLVLSLGTLLVGAGAFFARRARRNIRSAAILAALLLPVSIVVLLHNGSFFFPETHSAVLFDHPQFLPLMAAAAAIVAPAFLVQGAVLGACFSAMLSEDRRRVPYLIAVSAGTFVLGYSVSAQCIQWLGLFGVVAAASVLALVPLFPGRRAVIVILVAAAVLPLDRGDRVFAAFMKQPGLWPVSSTRLTRLGGGWSPYARVDFYQTTEHTLAGVYNGVQQWMATTRAEENFDLRRQGYSFFTGDILLVGAGGGNGVQSLRGASSVTAVELDPLVVEYMRDRLERFNQGAYRSPKVDVVVGDARAYLESSSRKFDALIYEGADVNVSSNRGALVSMENYLYTREGLGAAFSALQPDGVLYVFFSAEMPVVRKVLASLPAGAHYGIYAGVVREPLRFPYRLLIASRNANRIAALPEYFGGLGLPLRELNVTKASLAAESPLTDNRPFLYISSPKQVAFLGYVLFALLGILALAIGRSESRRLGVFLGLIGAAFVMTELLLVNMMRSVLGGFLETAALVVGAMTAGYAAGNLCSRRVGFAGIVAATIIGFAIVCATGLLGPPGGSALIRAARVILVAAPVGFAMGLYLPRAMALTRDDQAGWSIGVDTLGTALGSVTFYVVMISFGLLSVAGVALGAYVTAALLLRRAGALS